MQSSSRNGHRPRVLAVHTTEGIMRAKQLRDWTGWKGSSHAAADETGVLMDGAGDGFVDHDRASWTLRSGNPWSENIELCAYAKWTRTEWLSRPKLLGACATWLARRSKARGIPLVKLTPAQYRAGQSGVIGHHDHTVGYSDGTHWDPGPNFPWDIVLNLAKSYRGDPGGSIDLPDAEAPPILLGDDMPVLVQTTDGHFYEVSPLIRGGGRYVGNPNVAGALKAAYNGGRDIKLSPQDTDVLIKRAELDRVQLLEDVDGRA